jgi:hypothetical protein
MTYRSPSPRSSAPLAIVLLLVGVFAGGLGLGQLPGRPGWPQFAGFGGARHDPATGELRRSTPVRLTIASIDVRARVVGVGRAVDGSIATPPTAETTGWYDDGPAPGQRGTAVIVGHVDTRTAPAVFRRLREVSRGTAIEVRRRDRTVARFTVDSVETFPKSTFPAARVFGDVGRPRLALVTCGGEWIGGETGYADNVVVFATLT